MFRYVLGERTLRRVRWLGAVGDDGMEIDDDAQTDTAPAEPETKQKRRRVLPEECQQDDHQAKADQKPRNTKPFFQRVLVHGFAVHFG